MNWLRQAKEIDNEMFYIPITIIFILYFAEFLFIHLFFFFFVCVCSGFSMKWTEHSRRVYSRLVFIIVVVIRSSKWKQRRR